MATATPPSASSPHCTGRVERTRRNGASGFTLTGSCGMFPASSVSGSGCDRSDAKFLAFDKLGQDQIEDHATRKGVAVADVEKWLGPYLDY